MYGLIFLFLPTVKGNSCVGTPYISDVSETLSFTLRDKRNKFALVVSISVPHAENRLWNVGRITDLIHRSSRDINIKLMHQCSRPDHFFGWVTQLSSSHLFRVYMPLILDTLQRRPVSFVTFVLLLVTALKLQNRLRSYLVRKIIARYNQLPLFYFNLVHLILP